MGLPIEKVFLSEIFLIGIGGPSITPDVKIQLRQGLAGVVLFRRNIESREQVVALCREVREAARDYPPPIIAVDEEGGRVQRLRSLIGAFPSAREVARKGVEAAYEAGLAIGLHLRDLGLNVDFAPVLDVDSNPESPVIGDRSFSSDPRVVAECGVAFAKGLARAGIAACGKHFPGHGDAHEDSHYDLPVISAHRQTLEAREIPPFAAAVSAGIKLLMTAHCIYPAFDDRLPATLSSAILKGLLRQTLGFEGCIVTDDLGMKAISDRFSPEEVLALGLQAGVSLFMHCGGQGEGLQLIETLENLVAKGEIPKAWVAEAATKVWHLRTTLV